VPGRHLIPPVGTIMVGVSCGTNPNGIPAFDMVDRYWTDQDDGIAYLRSGGNPGLQASYSATPTCWSPGA
jgi:hypothetical protein